MGSIPDVQGYHHIRTRVNPGPGNEFALVPITATRIRIISLRFLFVTDATVVNRTVGLRITNGVVIAGELASNALHGPGVVQEYSLWPGFAQAAVATLQGTMMPWTGEVIFDQMYYLVSNTTNLQAGDAFTDIVYATEEWISEP